MQGYYYYPERNMAYLEACLSIQLSVYPTNRNACANCYVSIVVGKALIVKLTLIIYCCFLESTIFIFTRITISLQENLNKIMHMVNYIFFSPQGDRKKLYEELSDFLLQMVQEQSLNLTNKTQKLSQADQVITVCYSNVTYIGYCNDSNTFCIRAIFFFTVNEDGKWYVQLAFIK